MNRKQRRATRKKKPPSKWNDNISRMAKTFALAAQYMKAGELDKATAAYQKVLRKNPRHAPSLHYLGLIQHKTGNSEKAVDFLRQSLAIKSDDHTVHANLAAILEELGRAEEGIAACEKAISLSPGYAAAHASLGKLFKHTGQFAKAVEACEKALSINPESAAANFILAEALIAQDRLDEALVACLRVMELAPDSAEPHVVHARILECQGKLAEASEASRRALALDPGLSQNQERDGDLLRSQGRIDESIAAYNKAIELAPDNASAHHNLAISLEYLGQYDAALAAYNRALELNPNLAEAYSNLGGLLHLLRQSDKAIAAFNRAIEINPDFADAHHNLGCIFKDIGRIGEAIHAHRKALACNPELLISRYELCNLRRHACDWSRIENDEANCLQALRNNGVKVAPFNILAMCSNPSELLEHNRIHARQLPVEASKVIRQHCAFPGLGSGLDQARPIRIGYLSSDYHQHATGALVAELFERHDRARFEVFGYCHSHDDSSDMRKRLVASFDEFVSVRNLTHSDAARRIHNDRIDILVDLKGYTNGSRSEILKYRPAPIQVNFLGYPSTMGADFIDYIIADPYIAPVEHQAYFDEAVVHLPNTYQPNDTHRKIASKVPSRANCGLPEQAFVFCSFNNAYKITGEMFSIWMRLLEKIEGSVLWLYQANSLCKANLQHEAAVRGIDPARLVFAKKLPMDEHLARHRLADLFLDTLPYNAHTTASDALWAGLPVLTCAGEAFPGRVAGSLLKAIGLPELITDTLEEYEALALRLAKDRPMLRALQDKLRDNRTSTPLFDIKQYTRDIESAFQHMVQLHATGHAPTSFAVSDLAKGGEISAMLTKPETMPGRIAYTGCPLCNSSDIPYHIEADITNHALYAPELPKTMKWRICQGCQHVFTEGHYTPEMCEVVFSKTHASQTVGHDLEGQRIISGRIVERISRYVPDGDWLDIGFGNGSLLFTAQEWGYTPVGIDLRKDNVEAVKKLDIEAHCLPVEEIDDDGRFSVVSMADVLEHIPFPKQALAAVCRLLRKKGVLFVSMPNMDSIVWRALDAQASNPYWQEIEHYHNFTRGRLNSLLEENGFKVLNYNISERYRSCMEIIAVKT